MSEGTERDEPSAPADRLATGNEERRRIAGRAGIVALGTLLSRVLGLVRDMVLAAVFSRAATDAWMVAFQIPNLLRQLFAEGAVQTAVLPVLTQVREQEGDAGAKRYFSYLRGLSLVSLLLVTALGMFFADELVELFASGFHARPGQFELTAKLTRWVFPYVLFMGTAALGVAALNTYRRFVVTSFAPALLNVAFIAFSFGVPTWLASKSQEPILAMAIGALVGGALQVVAQWPSLKKIGYLTAPRLSLAQPAVKETLRRLAPTLLGIGVYYIDVIIGRRLLSDLGEGAVTYFGYALRLCDFSQGIFVMALSSATLPSLAGFASRGELDEVGQTFSYAMRHALFVGLASTALFVTLAQPIVTVLLQRGQFDQESAHQTALALMAQGLGIFLVAGVRQLVLVYYAFGDTKIPVYVAIVDVVVFASTSILLMDNLGHVGVSLGVTAARIAQFTLLWLFLRRRLPDRRGPEIGRSAAKHLVASLAAAGSAWLALGALPAPTGGLIPGLLSLVGSTTVFGVTFVLVSRLVGTEELNTISDPILRRLRLKPR